MTLETRKNKKSKIVIYLIIFFIFRELSYFLLEDLGITRLSFFNLEEPFKYRLQTILFTFLISYISYLSDRLNETISIWGKLILLFITFLVAFCISVYIFQISKQKFEGGVPIELRYHNIKYLLFYWLMFYVIILLGAIKIINTFFQGKE